jgi:hypothetical protein
MSNKEMKNSVLFYIVDSGFALGDTIESTTKGIWAWCQIHPKMSNTVLLLLDTEGLGDIEKVSLVYSKTFCRQINID